VLILQTETSFSASGNFLSVVFAWIGLRIILLQLLQGPDKRDLFKACAFFIYTHSPGYMRNGKIDGLDFDNNVGARCQENACFTR